MKVPAARFSPLRGLIGLVGNWGRSTTRLFGISWASAIRTSSRFSRSAM